MRLVAVKGILVRLVAAAAILASAALGSGCFGVTSEFLRGYRDGAGPVEHEMHLVMDVIPCESEWISDKVSPAYQRGLAQFTDGTWAAYARFGAETDWRDPYEQGWAVANLLNGLRDIGLEPWSTQGWPWCWLEGL
jgi:soluble lytic murein transglycosylase-like protein